jgi:hypothetical protein
VPPCHHAPQLLRALLIQLLALQQYGALALHIGLENIGFDVPLHQLSRGHPPERVLLILSKGVRFIFGGDSVLVVRSGEPSLGRACWLRAQSLS